MTPPHPLQEALKPAWPLCSEDGFGSAQGEAAEPLRTVSGDPKQQGSQAAQRKEHHSEWEAQWARWATRAPLAQRPEKAGQCQEPRNTETLPSVASIRKDLPGLLGVWCSERRCGPLGLKLVSEARVVLGTVPKGPAPPPTSLLPAWPGCSPPVLPARVQVPLPSSWCPATGWALLVSEGPWGSDACTPSPLSQDVPRRP